MSSTRQLTGVSPRQEPGPGRGKERGEEKGKPWTKRKGAGIEKGSERRSGLDGGVEGTLCVCARACVCAHILWDVWGHVITCMCVFVHVCFHERQIA